MTLEDEQKASNAALKHALELADAGRFSAKRLRLLNPYSAAAKSVPPAVVLACKYDGIIMSGFCCMFGNTLRYCNVITDRLL